MPFNFTQGKVNTKMQTQPKIQFTRTRKAPPKVYTNHFSLEDNHIENLTLKQELFCHYYATNDIVGTQGNGTASAKAAGFAESWAHVAACELLKLPKILKRIDEIKATLFQDIRVDAYRVVQELASIGFANEMDYYNSDGSIRNPKQMPRWMTAAIKEIEITVVQSPDGSKVAAQKLKLHDKRPALELIGKHLKMFTDVFEMHPGENLQKHDEKAKATRARLLQSVRDQEEAEKVVQEAMKE